MVGWCNMTNTMNLVKDAFEMRQRVAQLLVDQQSPQERESLIRLLAQLLDVSSLDVRAQMHRDARVLRGDL